MYAALRTAILMIAKGGGAYAVRLNTQPLTLNGQTVTLSPKAA